MKKITNKLVVLYYLLTRFFICIFILNLSINFGHGIIVFRWSLPAGFVIVALYAICMSVLDVAYPEILGVTSQFFIIILDVFAIYVVYTWSIVSSACIMMIFCLLELGFIKYYKKEEKTTSNDEIKDIEG